MYLHGFKKGKEKVQLHVMSMWLDIHISEGAFLTQSQADHNKKGKKGNLM